MVHQDDEYKDNLSFTSVLQLFLVAFETHAQKRNQTTWIVIDIFVDMCNMHLLSNLLTYIYYQICSRDDMSCEAFLFNKIKIRNF